jgi:hypothetical protein
VFSFTVRGQLVDSLLYKARNTFFSLKYNNGAVLNTNDFVNGKNHHEKSIDSYQSLSIGFGKQTRGKHDWEHVHNFPEFGVAFYTAKFQRGSELGYPNALLGFYNAPFHRWERSALMFNIGFGLTYNWRPYNQEDNPFNIAIGSYRTVYVGLGVGYNYYLSRHWVLSGGLEANHFSNGAMRKPNKGLNMVAPYVSVNYLLGEVPRFERKYNIPHLTKNEIYFYLGFGQKREEFDTVKYSGLKDSYQDVMYRAMTLSTAMMRQYSHKSKAGIGFDVIYDEWLGSSIKVNGNGKADKILSNSVSDRFSVGMFASHEFCISRLSIVTQVGTYIWRKNVANKKNAVYQRAGLKYHFKNDMFVGINIFAHNMSSADFIEWNAGYRIKWPKK